MKAILFDIDGTLILTGGAGHLAYVQTFAEEFGVAEITIDVAFAGRSDRAIAHDLMVAHDIDPSDDNWHRFCDGYLRRLPEAVRSLSGHVLPGVLHLLDRLAGLPVLVGLLTGNIRAGAQIKLSHYSLWNRFDFGGFGDDYLERSEIAAAAVAAARERAQSNGSVPSTDMVVVIGDTEYDIHCARAIGARAVSVATGGTPASVLKAEKPDLLIESLEDARVLLDWVA